MTKLTQKVTELAKKENILEITIANSEGLPITSTAQEVDKESAEGVDEVQQRLLKSGMKYLTVVDKKGMKVLYYDTKFYYIVRSSRTVSDKVIGKFRQLLDSEMAEREGERQKREEELKKVKEEREQREAQVRKVKEEREQREAQVKQIKEQHDKLDKEALKIKESREKMATEVKNIKEERERARA
jgi:hypothetical protein